MIASYTSLREKVARVDSKDWKRVARLLQYYCTLSELYPVERCIVCQEKNRCPLFEEVGPGVTIPDVRSKELKKCKCVRREDIYACPLYRRFSDIYADIMEDLENGD